MSDGHRHGGGDCRAIFEKLSDYIDGELPVDLCDRIEGHMVDCAPCQAFLESLRRTVRLVEQVDSPPVPAEVRREISLAWDEYRRRSDRT